MRFALPNARIMLHQPSGGFQGQATDIMLHAQEILNLKKRLNEIYVKHTGQPLKKIEDALERDYFLTGGDGQGMGRRRQGDRQAAGGPGGAQGRVRPAARRVGTGSRPGIGPNLGSRPSKSRHEAEFSSLMDS